MGNLDVRQQDLLINIDLKYKLKYVLQMTDSGFSNVSGEIPANTWKESKTI